MAMQSAVKKDLGYEDSPNFFLTKDIAERHFSGHSHIYRKAHEKCGLRGVYLLNDPRGQADIPVLFYCEAKDEKEADSYHRKIWNQDIVPFILVETPKTLRLYSGFRFAAGETNDREKGILEASIAFNEAASRLSSFHAKAIDNGAVWDHWGKEVDPRSRVDWSLLAKLKELEQELRNQGLTRGHVHALIGKFVYLRYLKDREILSDRKLAKWQIDPQNIFSHRATLTAFRELNARLEDWLNGSVFPIPDNAITADSLKLVANVFSGGTSQGQLALDFQIYDFSFIPIETLSVIYEQFLHAPEEGRVSRGRETGAYYTPIPLVNYMLNELESHRPLKEGMKVLDPSCGSGAFLVQCYRSLIEKKSGKNHLRPAELRELLIKHIFGVDRDGDACQVAEMSLILTLLDYTTPPDLENSPNFKLPTLRGRNIFQADFFDPDSEWDRIGRSKTFDWLVGNPPWREAKAITVEDQYVIKWTKQNEDRFSTGGNQIAEAYVWHSLPLLNESSVAALALPAMTLFKKESTQFRAQLFRTVQAWCITNFANLAYTLFSGRSEAPALSIFFSPRSVPKQQIDIDERILTYAPLMANQRANRPNGTISKKDTWSLAVNGAEMREIPAASIASGNFREWKQAMWGSYHDSKLLSRIDRRFPSMADFVEQNNLHIHQGLELRTAESKEETNPFPELAGRLQIDFSYLKKCGHIFAFPNESFSEIPEDMAYVSKRGGAAGLVVSEPPHIIIDVSRRFAVYSDKFIAIPPRQIGISGPADSARLLQAMSLYMSSDFCPYHQFFLTPQWGISHSIATLDALKMLPIPLDRLGEKDLNDWAEFHAALVTESSQAGAVSDSSLQEVNSRVYQLLGLSRSERILVEDFVHWNMQMVKGKVNDEIISPPKPNAMQSYLNILKGELDDFIGQDSGTAHEIKAVKSDDSAMISISLVQGKASQPNIYEASKQAAASLFQTKEHLLCRHSQWLYFERCLKIYDHGAMYIFKPLEMIHWTRRQAILDAGEIIAETLSGQGD
jgi:hypothetical protein